MTAGPTIFQTLLAVKTTRGLFSMALINLMFMSSIAALAPFAVNVPNNGRDLLFIGGPVTAALPLVTHLMRSPALPGMGAL